MAYTEEGNDIKLEEVKLLFSIIGALVNPLGNILVRIFCIQTESTYCISSFKQKPIFKCIICWFYHSRSV